MHIDGRVVRDEEDVGARQDSGRAELSTSIVNELAEAVIVFALEQFMAVDLRHTNSKAKVGDYQLSLAVNQQVLRLDIPMHYAVRVQVTRTFYQLV